jgi:hypothetical protein
VGQEVTHVNTKPTSGLDMTSVEKLIAEAHTQRPVTLTLVQFRLLHDDGTIDDIGSEGTTSESNGEHALIAPRHPAPPSDSTGRQFACDYQASGCHFKSDFVAVEAHERSCTYRYAQDGVYAHAAASSAPLAPTEEVTPEEVVAVLPPPPPAYVPTPATPRMNRCMNTCIPMRAIV